MSLVDLRTDRILWADRMTGRGENLAELMEDVCGMVVSAVDREIGFASRGGR